jgi:carbamoylphosphate synthase small subunit
MKSNSYTKDKIVELSGLSKRTVTRTLRACGVNTRVALHSEYEYQLFCQARTLFKKGVRTKDIKEFFSKKKIEGEVYQEFLEEANRDQIRVIN